jgi:hypothetical protein
MNLIKSFKPIFILIPLMIAFCSCPGDKKKEQPDQPKEKLPPKVVMNEIAPNEKLDWIEFYNTDAVDTADLRGYDFVNITKLTDTTKIYLYASFILTAKIPPHGYLVLDCDGTVTTKRENFNEKKGEFLALQRADRKTVDSVYFPPNIPTGSSYARVPDGGDWFITTNQTKGASNKK